MFRSYLIKVTLIGSSLQSVHLGYHSFGWYTYSLFLILHSLAFDIGYYHVHLRQDILQILSLRDNTNFMNLKLKVYIHQTSYSNEI